MNRKVTVVGGAGNVGATVARGVADKSLADVVVIDIADQKAAGVALDMLEACPIWGSDSRVLGTGDYAESANSDIVVITSGMPRKPGMSRDDLLNVNYKIMQQVTEQVVKHSPNCIIIVVSNPLDAMAQAVYKLSKFPRERVIGMAGVLDSARMRAFIAKELNVSVENVHAFVLGGHGDTMVPLPRYSTVAGIPITDLMDKATIDRILRADGGRRPGDHAAGRHERLVRARRVRRGDGRGDSARQEEDPAVLGVPAGRIRREGPVRRRPVQARIARAREDHRDQADARRRRRLQEVRRLRQRARRRDRSVSLESEGRRAARMDESVYSSSVRAFTEPQEAEMARGALQAAGIEATFVTSDSAGGSGPEMRSPNGGVDVIVRTEDAEGPHVEVLDGPAKPRVSAPRPGLPRHGLRLRSPSASTPRLRSCAMTASAETDRDFLSVKPLALATLGGRLRHRPLAAPGRRPARKAFRRASSFVGLDRFAPMLARARGVAPGARLVRARAEELPWRDATFDRIFCVNALHHFSDRHRFFAEARRILKPGGGVLTIGKDPHAERDSWWVYDYFEETLEIDRTRFARVRTLRGDLATAGFAWAESVEADHIDVLHSASDALANGVVDRSFTSQLTVLSDEEFARGVARLRAADAESGGQLQLVADFRLYATIGWVG